MEEVQSWWEVPNISYFCFLFRQAFNLLEFDIEELEEALVLDGIEGGNTFLQQLTIGFLKGCYRTNKVTSVTWEKYLRDILQKKWVEEEGQSHPFPDNFSSFYLLPLRTKVQILHALCNYRLDCIDVNEAVKGMEADSLRIRSLGQDDGGNVYWYFYGTRLYKEAVIDSLYTNDWDTEWQKEKRKVLKIKKRKRGRPKKYLQGTSDGENEESEEDQKTNLENSPAESRWSVVCTTENEWYEFVEKFRRSQSDCERQLYRSLTQDFLPVLKQLFLQKERNMRKRLLEMVPRRASARLEKQRLLREEEERFAVILEAEEQERKLKEEEKRRLEEVEKKKEQEIVERKRRAEERHKMSKERAARASWREQKAYCDNQELEFLDVKQDSPMAEECKDADVLSSENEEELYSGMQNVLDAVKSHKSAWPFLQPVNESYAPGYFSIIKEPVDLSSIEYKLQQREYKSEIDMIQDFKKMVENCECYNGRDSKYTAMANSLRKKFRKAMKKYCFVDAFEDEESNQCVDIFSNGPEEFCISGHEEIERVDLDFFSEFKGDSAEKPKRKKKRKRPPGMKAIEALAHAAEQALRDAAGNRNFEEFSFDTKSDSLDHVSSAFPGLKITGIQNHPASLRAKYFPNAPLSTPDINSNETSSPFSYSLTSDSNQDSEQTTDCENLRRSSTDSMMSSEENGNTNGIADSSVINLMPVDSLLRNVTNEKLEAKQKCNDDSHKNSENDKEVATEETNNIASEIISTNNNVCTVINYENNSKCQLTDSLSNVSSTSSLTILNAAGEKSETQSLNDVESPRNSGVYDEAIAMDICSQVDISSSSIATGENLSCINASDQTDAQQPVISLSVQPLLDGSTLKKTNQLIPQFSDENNIRTPAQLTPCLPVLGEVIRSQEKSANCTVAKIGEENSLSLPLQEQNPLEELKKSVQVVGLHSASQHVEYSQTQMACSSEQSVLETNQNITSLPQQTLMQNSSIHQEQDTISANKTSIPQPTDSTVPMKKRAFSMETPSVNYQNSDFVPPASIPCSQGLDKNVINSAISTGMKPVCHLKCPPIPGVVLRTDKQWNSQTLPQDNGPPSLPLKNDFMPFPYTSSIPNFARHSVIIGGPPNDGQNYQNLETFGTSGAQPLLQFGAAASNSTSSSDYFGSIAIQGNSVLQNKDQHFTLNARSNNKNSNDFKQMPVSHGAQQKNISCSTNMVFSSQPYCIPTSSQRTVHGTQKSNIVPVTTFAENVYSSAPVQSFTNKPAVTVNSMFLPSNNYSRSQNQSVCQPPSPVKSQQTQVVQKQPFVYNNSDALPVKNLAFDSQYPPVFRELEPKFPVNYSARPQFVQYTSQFVQNDHQNGQYMYQPQRINSEGISPPSFISSHVLPSSNYHPNSAYVTGDTSNMEVFNLPDPHPGREMYCDKYAYLKSVHRSSLK